MFLLSPAVLLLSLVSLGRATPVSEEGLVSRAELQQQANTAEAIRLQYMSDAIGGPATPDMIADLSRDAITEVLVEESRKNNKDTQSAVGLQGKPLTQPQGNSNFTVSNSLFGAAGYVDGEVLEDLKTHQAYAAAAYCLAGIDKWTCKERCTGSTAGTVIVKRFDDLLYNTAGFIGYNTRRKHIIVSFKGSASIRNFITDLKLYKVDAQYKLDRLKVPSGAKIHGGFAEGYNAARKQIRQTVKQILDGPGKGFEVHVTGHSLGGALAILGGIDMFDFLGDAYKNRIRVYAYGEPRVGNKAWADWVYTLPFYERMYRVTGKSDIVTLIPPTWMDFRHHRAEYWIKGGKTTQCDDSLGEAAACAASAIIPSILDHITGYFDIPFGPWC